ncbi:sensor histidine kinase [Jeotgalibacillus proteolyticus]|uniref:Sensor histidine kinase n=1 Tax=Jeotgalibacillus proteolyticus TaxID=2082395 RepID=A0A2S5G7C5_9BACL|nr:sensor histidine kinase [Jeotgalibacillus proteolyticus]PPA68887.1 sensor histidine kinase [Jeotgalibacillus proteolyticus]
MTIVTRCILQALGLSFIMVFSSLGVYLLFFPPENWNVFWNTRLLDIPLVFFLLMSICLLASGWGLMQSLGFRQQIQYISHQLEDSKLGRSTLTGKPPQTAEFAFLSKEASAVQEMISQQARTAQRLASERVENQEKVIQEMVSQERNRLARELHDSVSQQLFAASMLMSAINETNEDKSDGETKQLKMVEEMIHQSQLEMRALLLHLRPVALKGKTLQEGLSELLSELQQKVPMTISWKAEDLKLAKGIEDHLFRILQESVSNTLRHAKANTLQVLCILRDGYVILRVVDDGKGFDATTERAGSYGLNNMKERAGEIGGTLKIVSLPGKGTRLEVRVPFEEREERTS